VSAFKLDDDLCLHCIVRGLAEDYVESGNDPHDAVLMVAHALGNLIGRFREPEDQVRLRRVVGRAIGLACRETTAAYAARDAIGPVMGHA
jgi:hypothetical protein